MKWLGVLLLHSPGWDASPSQITPQYLVAGTHLYSWLERGTVRVKCLAQKHNTVTPARARTQTGRSSLPMSQQASNYLQFPYADLRSGSSGPWPPFRLGIFLHFPAKFMALFPGRTQHDDSVRVEPGYSGCFMYNKQLGELITLNYRNVYTVILKYCIPLYVLNCGSFLFLQVAKEIWICEHRKITPWKGDILSYKQELKKKVTKKQK